LPLTGDASRQRRAVIHAWGQARDHFGAGPSVRTFYLYTHNLSEFRLYAKLMHRNRGTTLRAARLLQSSSATTFPLSAVEKRQIGLPASYTATLRSLSHR
jgi:hypothetical protein